MEACVRKRWEPWKQELYMESWSFIWLSFLLQKQGLSISLQKSQRVKCSNLRLPHMLKVYLCVGDWPLRFEITAYVWWNKAGVQQVFWLDGRYYKMLCIWHLCIFLCWWSGDLVQNYSFTHYLILITAANFLSSFPHFTFFIWVIAFL